MKCWCTYVFALFWTRFCWNLARNFKNCTREIANCCSTVTPIFQSASNNTWDKKTKCRTKRETVEKNNLIINDFFNWILTMIKFFFFNFKNIIPINCTSWNKEQQIVFLWFKTSTHAHTHTHAHPHTHTHTYTHTHTHTPFKKTVSKL
jgi:hypothetical protein